MPKKTTLDFYRAVYDVVLLIPKGRVSTYGAIAEFLSAKGAARMVGYAMNASHNLEFKIPAHRVVNRNGLLTGKHHFEGSNTMQNLLEEEGVTLVENQIQNFKQAFWHPNKELK